MATRIPICRTSRQNSWISKVMTYLDRSFSIISKLLMWCSFCQRRRFWNKYTKELYMASPPKRSMSIATTRELPCWSFAPRSSPGNSSELTPTYLGHQGNGNGNSQFLRNLSTIRSYSLRDTMACWLSCRAWRAARWVIILEILELSSPSKMPSFLPITATKIGTARPCFTKTRRLITEYRQIWPIQIWNCSWQVESTLNVMRWRCIKWRSWRWPQREYRRTRRHRNHQIR